MSEACRADSLSSIAAVNADLEVRVTLVPVGRDPLSKVDQYGSICGKTDDAACGHLRRTAMAWRASFEDAAVRIVCHLADERNSDDQCKPD